MNEEDDAKLGDDACHINTMVDENSCSNGQECPSINTGDETDDDCRKLFVGGLSWGITESDLKDYFSRWGKVTHCVIKLDKVTGCSRGFGFVTLENEECVNDVLSVNDHSLKNKKIDPKRAKPSREPSRKIFVGGLDPDITEDQIRSYFGEFGRVESVDLPFDLQKGKRKYYVFVSFANEAAARKAISKERQEIFGCQCDVRVAVTREQANRQRVLKQYYDWYDQNFSYGLPYCDLSNAYAGMDLYGYGCYGYDYYGGISPNAPTYGSYTNYPSNQPRRLTGSRINQNARTGPGTHNPRPIAAGGIGGGGGNNTGVSSTSLAGQHQPQSHKQHPHTDMNFSNFVGPPLMDLHYYPRAPLSTGLDFGHSHTPSQNISGIVSGTPAGFSRP